MTLAAAAQAAGCVPADISQAAAAVQDARAALMELPVKTGTDATTAISASGEDGIVAMKVRLADFILAYMRCQPEDVDVNGIAVDLSRLGWARAPEPGRHNDETSPLALHAGWALSFETRAPAQGLIGITAIYGIPCGSDAQLMLFDHRDTGWTEIMRVAARPYRDVAQAHWAFDYAVSPSDAKDGWFLVEKHLPTNCVSVHSSITYAVLRPSSSALKPRILFTRHDGLYWGDEDYGRLSVGADSFEIRFHDYDGNANPTEIVRRFSVSGNVVRPIGQGAP